MSTSRRIASRDNPLLARIRKLLADPGGYRKLGVLWLEGQHLCEAFAGHGGVPAQVVVSEPGWEQPALRTLAERAAEVAIVPASLMAGLSALDSPAPIGFVVPVPTAAHIAPGVPSIVLDRLQDPGNVGTVLRSAAAFGFRQVVAMKGSAALWSPKVLRAGMGAHFGLRLVESVETDALGELGLPLLAADAHAARALHEAALPWPCAWVLGHEGGGIAPSLSERCTMALRIAQPGGEESLNVASAAAVCLYESARQRLST